MAMTPIDPVRLRVTSLSSKAIDYLRFMNGREVSARIVRGGGAEDVLHIRMGGHLLKARLSGTALPSGRDFFVRVETMKDGSFRLVVLSGLEKTGLPAGGPAGTGAGNAPGISPGFLKSYLTFLGAALQTARQREPGKERQAKGDLGRLDPAGQKRLLGDILGKIAAGNPPGQELSFMGEPVDLVLMDEWREPADSAPGKGGRERGDSGPDDQQNSAENPGEEADVIGWGNQNGQPASFCVRIRLPRLGTIGVLILSQNADFEHPTVYVTPLKPEVLRLMQSKMAGWREILGEQIPGLGDLALLPPEQNTAGSVDFSA